MDHLGVPVVVDLVVAQPVLVALIDDPTWRSVAENLKRRVSREDLHARESPAVEAVDTPALDQ
jgi:hypothetical protein